MNIGVMGMEEETVTVRRAVKLNGHRKTVGARRLSESRDRRIVEVCYL